jgi:Transposase DDE domain
MDLSTIFFDIDNFCQAFATYESLRLARPGARCVREPELAISEVMTIIVWFHQSGYRTFKRFYTEDICGTHKHEFPNVPSYNRFVERAERAMLPLSLFLRTRYGKCTGISFIDSTTIDVCQNQRIRQHKVFKSVAKRGKTSTGWFYGFKLHLTVNECGELLGVQFTPGDARRQRAFGD